MFKCTKCNYIQLNTSISKTKKGLHNNYCPKCKMEVDVIITIYKPKSTNNESNRNKHK